MAGFLTQEQRNRYGRFNGTPAPEDLTRYCYLSPEDKKLARKNRPEAYQQLGFAIQLMTVRYLGTFLKDMLDVPNAILVFAAEQMEITDTSRLEMYLQNPDLATDHHSIIRRQYGYTKFSNSAVRQEFSEWLHARCWYSIDGLLTLMDLSTAHLITRKILLPEVTVIERLVQSVRAQSLQKFWGEMAGLVNADQGKRLTTLLQPGESDFTSISFLEEVKRGPTQQSKTGLLQGLHRLGRLRALGVSDIQFAELPMTRIRAMAYQAASLKTYRIANFRKDRRMATLLAFAFVYETRALDDALDLFFTLLALVFSRAILAGEKERLRTLKDLDAAALEAARTCRLALDPEVRDKTVQAAILDEVNVDTLQTAINKIFELARPADDRYTRELIERFRQISGYLLAVLKMIEFQATTGGQPIKASLSFLKTHMANAKADYIDAPREGLRKPWTRYVLDETGKVSRQGYTVWVAHRMYDGLRRHDLYASRSARWGDVSARLLNGDRWDKVKGEMCRALDLSPSPAIEIELLTKELDETYRATQRGWASNKAVRFENGELVLSKLDALEEPDSLVRLRKDIRDQLPLVDLPEVLIEMEAKAPFTRDFVPVTESLAHDPDLPLTICGVLIADACNVSFGPIAREDHPALTIERLAFVKQNYFRADTYAAANRRLVDMQKKIDLVKYWGAGEVASADGLRFVVPVPSANAMPNSKYFGPDRGVTLYSVMTNQFTTLKGIVVPGTMRDSIYTLEVLLEQTTSLAPKELMTDTHGYSDIVFALFWLLGYRFSPRLADIGDARFWRIDPNMDYGELNRLARHTIRVDRIMLHWEDMLRIAASLKLGEVKASQVMEMLSGGSLGSSLAQAIAELGRIIKTIQMLTYLSDESYRRRILVMLNRGELRNKLARRTFHGQRGELRQGYREGQENQLGALGFVTNAIVVWNTIYMDLAVKDMRASGLAVADTDLARLSPLSWGHINMDGRYNLLAGDAVRQGLMRPLRKPKPTDTVREAWR